MNTFEIILNVNGGEYTSAIILECNSVKRIGEKKILIDNLYPLYYVEDILEIKQLNKKDKEYDFYYNLAIEE